MASHGSAQAHDDPAPDEPAEEGLRARKKRETRARLLAAARQLFSERGFAETKVEDITASLALSPGTFFNYFGSKDAALLEISENLVGDFVALLEQTEAALAAGEASLRGTIERAASASPVAAQEVNRRLYAELMRVTLPHEAGGRILQRVRDALVRVVERAQERGELRADRDARDLAELAADLLTGVLNNWLNDPQLALGARVQRACVFWLEAAEGSAA